MPVADAEAEPGSALETAEVAAHTLLLRRGTYCIYVVAASPGIANGQLPGLGISAAPGEENTSLEVARLSGEQWLRQPGDALLVRVRVPQVRLLLTSYNIARTRGAEPPKIEVQRLDPGTTAPATQPEAAPSRPAEIIAHVRTRGDVRGQYGEWVGEPEQGLWIEGFTIAPPPGLEPGDLEYQAVLGKGWMSPWVQAGEFCGSRGMNIPIQGLRLRLNNAAEKRVQLTIGVRFEDGTVQDAVRAGELCMLDPIRPVTAIQVTHSSAAPAGRPRAAQKAPATAPKGRRFRL